MESFDRRCGKEKRGRPAKVNQSPILSVFSVINMLLFMLLVCNAEGTIREVKLCATTENKIVMDVDRLCDKKEITDGLWHNLTVMNNHRIYAKKHHEISGEGFKCKAERKTYSFKVTKWGAFDDWQSEWTPIKLEPEDCWTMVKKNKCVLTGDDIYINLKMNCDKFGCRVFKGVVEEHSYFQDLVKHAYRCKMEFISILGNNVNTSLFLDDKCYALDKQCIGVDSIVVWDLDIIHKCPYEELVFAGNWSFIEGFLMNDFDSIVLKPVKVIGCCKYANLIETAEGFFVTDKQNAKILSSAGVKKGNIEDYNNDLLLANIDYGQLMNSKMMGKLEDLTCKNAQNTLSLFRNSDGRYLRMINKLNQEVILYAKEGLIYVPECRSVKIIKFSVLTTCHKEIPVIYSVLTTERLAGFITKNNIVVHTAKSINCSINSDVIIVSMENEPRGKYQRKGNNIIKVSTNSVSWKVIDFFSQRLDRVNMHHPNAIINGHDSLKDYFNLRQEMDSGSTFYVQPESDTELHQADIAGKINTITENMASPFKTLIKDIYFGVFIFGLFVLLIVCVLLILYCSKIFNPMTNYSKPKRKFCNLNGCGIIYNCFINKDKNLNNKESVIMNDNDENRGKSINVDIQMRSLRSTKKMNPSIYESISLDEIQSAATSNVKKIRSIN